MSRMEIWDTNTENIVLYGAVLMALMIYDLYIQFMNFIRVVHERSDEKH